MGIVCGYSCYRNANKYYVQQMKQGYTLYFSNTLK